MPKNFNFTQEAPGVWRVRDGFGSTFNASSDSFASARLGFLKWIWGGRHRPDKLSFDDWCDTMPVRFTYEIKSFN
jgi:hypothetical protein